MTNREKYNNVFAATFEADPEKVVDFAYKDTPEWDSIAHMMLIAGLEDSFGIELEPDDMLAVTSYASGMEALGRKGIVF